MIFPHYNSIKLMLKQPKGREVIYGFSDFELVSIF